MLNRHWIHAFVLALLASLLLAPIASAVMTSPPVTDGPADTKQPASSSRLIVELQSPPLTVAYKSQVGAAAADGRLNSRSAFAAQYVAQLQAEQAAFVSTMQQAVPTARVATLVNETGVTRQETYQVAFNGVTVDVGDADQAAIRQRLSKLPGVKAVYVDRLHTTELYTSTALIDAPAVWSQLGGRASSGEGVKVASMDAGVYRMSPMFDGAGYTYPPGYRPYGLGLTANNNGKIIVSRAYYRPWDPPKPTDNTPWPGPSGNPHGIHTASTAAGNIVTATYGGASVGQISGVAPRAFIMSYKVFYDSVNDNGGFYTAEGLAALDDIVMDGADVVNNSWGGGPGSSGGEFDPLDAALTNAFNAGVFVSMSAGNSGPSTGTADHPSPSYISVAASTTGGTYASGKVSVPGQSSLQDIEFAAASFGAPLQIGQVITFPVLPSIAVDPTNTNGCNAWPAGAFTGKAALIQRGSCEFGVKVLNAEQGGAAFVIVYNSAAGGDALINMGAGAVGNQVTIPSIFVGRTNGLGIVFAYNSDNSTQVQVDTIAYQAGNTADRIVAFSSRGPGVGNTLKPDIAAPGYNILAQGYTPGASGMDVYLGYGQASGTSMASPHVAGAAALVRQAHPKWPTSWIKSALMSTSKYLDIYNYDETPAQPLDMGAGRLLLTHVTDPGVILDPPSLSFGVAPTGTSKTISVTVTSVAAAAETYRLSTLFTGHGFTQTTALPGFSINPTQLDLAPGQSKVVAVTFNSADSQGYGDNQGYILLDGATHNAHLPAWARVTAATPIADVLLLVNDFNTYGQPYGYTWYYTSTLAQLGLSYAIWNVDDYVGSDRTIPDITTLSAFPVIIHFTGDNYEPDGTYSVHTGLTSLDLDTLTEYLNGGGRIIAMGQDYSSAIGNVKADDARGSNNFYYTYRLGANLIQDSVSSGVTPNQLVIPMPSAPAALAGVRIDLTKPGKYTDEQDMTPAAGSAAQGSYSLRYDVAQKLLEVAGTVSPSATQPLTITAIQVQQNSTSGPVVFTLLSTSTFVTNSLDFAGSTVLDSSQAAALLAGNLYLNVLTTNKPAGELSAKLEPLALNNQPYVDELDNVFHDGTANPVPISGDPYGESTLGSTPLFSYPGINNRYAGTVALAHRDQPSLERPGATYAGRSIYTSFGLEGMSEAFNPTFGITPTSRSGLLGAFLTWLRAEPGTATIAPTMDATSKLYTFQVDLAAGTRAAAPAPVKIRWDFGDGSAYVTAAGVGGSASHQYVCSADNVHTVRAEVTDSLGVVTLTSLKLDASSNCNVPIGQPAGVYLPLIRK